MRILNEKGLSLIKEAESLELTAYPDPGSDLGKACTAMNLRLRSYKKVPNWKQLPGDPWTIGYGHTLGVKEGDIITKDQADKFLLEDIKFAEDAINLLITTPLNENQYSALVSFVYNCGVGNFKKGFLTKLNALDYEGAANVFPLYNKSKGKVLPGLIKRRNKEKNLFLEGIGVLTY